MALSDVMAGYQAKVASHLQIRQEVADAEARLARIRARAEDARPAWPEDFARPFGEWVRSELGYGCVEVSPLLGLASRVRVTVYPADLSDSADGLGGGCMDPRVVDITLEPGVARGPEEGFGIVDFSREARSYPPNSVGRMNGLQYDSIAITPEMGIGDVLAIAGRPELAPLAAPGLSR